MKKYITLLVAFAVLLVFPLHEVAACSHYGNIPDATSVSTVGVGNITTSSAVLKGHVSLGSNTSIDFAGFRFSLSSTCPVTGSEEVRFETTDAGNNYTATVKGLKHGTKYYFRAVVRINGQETCGEIMSFTTLASKVPEGAVDLGIVMIRKDGTHYNLYWAECNLGATNPKEYGNYYAWGETELKLDYSWTTYKWCNGSYDNFTKYNYNTFSDCGRVDNRTALDPTDDVAHVKLGGKWRMPTVAEWEELRTKCTWTWTRDYNGTGVSGRIITGPNGNSIFLPAAGCRNDTDLRDAGSFGCYWSSSLYTNIHDYAWYVYFNSGNVCRNRYNRFYGLSVRPVTE